MKDDVRRSDTDDRVDPRFCKAALDGLKAYQHQPELIIRCFKKHNVPAGESLDSTWVKVEAWLTQDRAHCLALLTCLDELRMWGRQRVVLFEVDEAYVEKLQSAEEVRTLARGRYDEPRYHWEAEEPFLARVEHTTAAGGDPVPLLRFKLIENRKYDLLVDKRLETFEERSTSFFIVNLRDRYAELRVQQLPTGAQRNFEEERAGLEKELWTHLDITKFETIQLEPVMAVMLRQKTFEVTAGTLKFHEREVSPETPELAAILGNLFRSPTPRDLNAYWDCRQDELGDRPLYFTLGGGQDNVVFNGIADPVRMNHILKRIVGISRGTDAGLPEDRGRGAPPPPPNGKGTGEGWAGPALRAEERPQARAVILSGGAIAASIIWVAIDGVGNYLAGELLDSVLGSLLLLVISIAIEIAWLWFYYGTKRVIYSFHLLRDLPKRRVWDEFRQARKRLKAIRKGDLAGP